jgi:hypothetical protein
MKNETQWTAMKRDRKYLPNELKGDRETVSLQLENLLVNRHLLGHVEAMTDQLDVYIKGRKVAIYMP